jgi:integrase
MMMGSNLEDIVSGIDELMITRVRDGALSPGPGLRAREVVALQLEDLNWQDGTVRIGAGKSRRVDVLPLPVLTGRALVTYLRHARTAELLSRGVRAGPRAA